MGTLVTSRTKMALVGGEEHDRRRGASDSEEVGTVRETLLADTALDVKGSGGEGVVLEAVEGTKAFNTGWSTLCSEILQFRGVAEYQMGSGICVHSVVLADGVHASSIVAKG